MVGVPSQKGNKVPNPDFGCDKQLISNLIVLQEQRQSRTGLELKSSNASDASGAILFPSWSYKIPCY